MEEPGLKARQDSHLSFTSLGSFQMGLDVLAQRAHYLVRQPVPSAQGLGGLLQVPKKPSASAYTSDIMCIIIHIIMLEPHANVPA